MRTCCEQFKHFVVAITHQVAGELQKENVLNHGVPATMAMPTHEGKAYGRMKVRGHDRDTMYNITDQRAMRQSSQSAQQFQQPQRSNTEDFGAQGASNINYSVPVSAFARRPGPGSLLENAMGSKYTTAQLYGNWRKQHNYSLTLLVCCVPHAHHSGRLLRLLQ